MKDKTIDYITQITLIGLVLILACTIDKVIKLNKKIENMEIVIKDLQDRVLNHEYRLEDIKPNDDLP